MKRRSLPVAAALAATAALLLTACGSGDDEASDNDKIAGADTGDATASDSPSASTSNDAGRPRITLPDDMNYAFEGWKTGDATKDAALSDAQQALYSVDDAITKGDTDSKALAFYFQGEALVSEVKWVQAWLDANITWTGTIRYFDPRVTLSDKKTAVVIYCAYDAKAYNKNRKTDKVDKTASADSPYVLYNTRMEKNAKGVWQTTGLLTKRGAEQCSG
ncbi:hypothetical protein ACFWWC_15675 [Streptomyces sp. NPDC058642]|uniref:hypothetical protein n=1 Tax=Streptomyces sp. NPDC058642 TaxID=3346572 RepID=UPI003658B9DA